MARLAVYIFNSTQNLRKIEDIILVKLKLIYSPLGLIPNISSIFLENKIWASSGRRVNCLRKYLILLTHRGYCGKKFHTRSEVFWWYLTGQLTLDF